MSFITSCDPVSNVLASVLLGALSSRSVGQGRGEGRSISQVGCTCWQCLRSAILRSDSSKSCCEYSEPSKTVVSLPIAEVLVLHGVFAFIPPCSRRRRFQHAPSSFFARKSPSAIENVVCIDGVVLASREGAHCSRWLRRWVGAGRDLLLLETEIGSVAMSTRFAVIHAAVASFIQHEYGYCLRCGRCISAEGLVVAETTVRRSPHPQASRSRQPSLRAIRSNPDLFRVPTTLLIHPRPP